MSETFFCRIALERLRKRAASPGRRVFPLRHMLVLPEGRWLRQPSHAHLGDCEGAPAALSSVSYEEAETICELPPRRFWPRDFSPASALIVNPEPHLDSPLRIHLFFGDKDRVQHLEGLAKDIVSLTDDLSRAIFDKEGFGVIHRGHSGTLDSLHALDAWLCTVHWWAWRTKTWPLWTVSSLI